MSVLTDTRTRLARETGEEWERKPETLRKGLGILVSATIHNLSIFC